MDRTGAVAAILALGLGMGCAHAEAQTPAPASAPVDAEADASSVRDPWEAWNRKVYAFNNTIDRTFAEPFARTYQRVTPTPIRSGVRNWVNNLGSPVIFANDLFQGAPKRAGVTALRFGVNTTIGVLGFFDPAKSMGLERHEEDFGQTLGRYGAKPGPYLMLPLLGPSSLRDVFGSLVDLGLDPLSYAQFDGDTAFRITRGAAALVTARTDSLETVANLRATSPDSYVTLRTAYAQSRRSLIRNGQDSVEDLPDFGDPLLESGEVSGATEAPEE